MDEEHEEDDRDRENDDGDRESGDVGERSGALIEGRGDVSPETPVGLGEDQSEDHRGYGDECGSEEPEGVRRRMDDRVPMGNVDLGERRHASRWYRCPGVGDRPAGRARDARQRSEKRTCRCNLPRSDRSER